MDDAEFDWTGRTMSTPVSCDQESGLHPSEGCRSAHLIRVEHVTITRDDVQVQNQDPISPSGRGRHKTGQETGKGTPAWSESKPSGIDILGGGGRLTDNRHPSVQVHR